MRSGFPPRELVPPSDPSLPVDLANGEKVSVDILPTATILPGPTMEVGVAAAGQDHTQPAESEQKLLETADSKYGPVLVDTNGNH